MDRMTSEDWLRLPIKESEYDTIVRDLDTISGVLENDGRSRLADACLAAIAVVKEVWNS